MTFGDERRINYSAYDHRRLPPNALPQRVLGGAAAVVVAALCAWTVCDLVGPDADRTDDALRADGVAGRGDRLVMVSRRGDKLAVAKPNSTWTYYALLFDPHPTSPASGPTKSQTVQAHSAATNTAAVPPNTRCGNALGGKRRWSYEL